MEQIWIVYREYTDWDEHQKDNIKAFTTEAQAEIWCENANSREDNLIELLTEAEDITAIERLCSMMPEYSKRLKWRLPEMNSHVLNLLKEMHQTLLWPSYSFSDSLELLDATIKTEIKTLSEISKDLKMECIELIPSEQGLSQWKLNNNHK